MVRRVAMDIARETQTMVLQEDLVSVALDTSDVYESRVRAALCVANIGDESSKLKLKPLVVSDAGNGPDDELKACGLMALWPERLTASELFSALTPKKDRDLSGFYDQFMRSDVFAGIAKEDCLLSLEWAAKMCDENIGEWRPEGEMVAVVMLKALDHSDVAGVIERLAALIRKRQDLEGRWGTEEQRKAFGQRLATDESVRRKLFVALLELYGPARSPTLHWDGFVTEIDLPWLLQLFDDQNLPVTILAAVAHLVHVLVYPQNVDGFDLVLASARRHPVLYDELARSVREIEIGSPQAIELKRRHDEYSARYERAPVLLDPPPATRILQGLDQSEAGEPEAFRGIA